MIRIERGADSYKQANIDEMRSGFKSYLSTTCSIIITIIDT